MRLTEVQDLLWAHMPEDLFSHGAAHLFWGYSVLYDNNPDITVKFLY